jgi:hypothetical protein
MVSEGRGHESPCHVRWWGRAAWPEWLDVGLGYEETWNCLLIPEKGNHFPFFFQNTLYGPRRNSGYAMAYLAYPLPTPLLGHGDDALSP